MAIKHKTYLKIQVTNIQDEVNIFMKSLPTNPTKRDIRRLFGKHLGLDKAKEAYADCDCKN